jgi:tetratricopeptide (TPR) repeat protein
LAEEDIIDRRGFLRALALTVPAVVVGRIETALLFASDGEVSPEGFQRVLASVRASADAGRTQHAIACLPKLIEHAEGLARGNQQAHFILAAQGYDLATDLLTKAGLITRARVTADRSRRLSLASESVFAEALSARGHSIVLRHDGSTAHANELLFRSVERLAGEGLGDERQFETYVQLLSTYAYTAAQAGQRAAALAALEEARRLGPRLPSRDAERGAAARVSLHTVSLYEVGTLWALNDAGHALEVARGLPPSALPTRERRARLHADVARAHWMIGDHRATAKALNEAAVESKDEVLTRPAIRAMATRLRRDHPGWPSVKALEATLVA